MSNWFSVSISNVSEDKRKAVFGIANTTLEPQRVRAVAAAAEMAGGPTFKDEYFKTEPEVFGLEPGETREVAISLTPRAPDGTVFPVRLRIEKADRTDDFIHSPGVELGIKIITPPKTPPWVWFAIGGSIIVTAVIGIILWQVLKPECEMDSECSNGFVCAKGECMCGALEECPASTSQCHEGTCKADCTKNGNACSSGQYCDPATKVCLAGCDDNSDCTKGFTCKNHQCRCGNLKACPAGDVCFNNQCRDECSATKKCPAGQHCETDAGACAPGCETDANCADGFSCNNGKCMCGTRSSCPRTSPLCVLDQCRAECGPGRPECPSPTYCFSNTACLPACNDQSDCPNGFSCNLLTHQCRCTGLNCRFTPHSGTWGRLDDVPFGRVVTVPIPRASALLPAPTIIPQPSPAPTR